MIQLVRPLLIPGAEQKLTEYQAVINSRSDYMGRVAFAKTDFPRKNTTKNRTFKEVRSKLLTMSSGAERCHYCEDSKADEVEHILPKDVYPDLCYDWNNYLYACGSCNGSKSNQAAVINSVTLSLHNLTPPKPKRNVPLPPRQSPITGVYGIIDPVRENPLDFFLLDIKTSSFAFSELPDENTINYLKAKYTLEVLRLNRSYLRKARSNAYNNFKGRLNVYIKKRNSGRLEQHQLDNIILGIKEEAHQTVWQEMIRQKDFIPELRELFRQAPEALQW